MKKGTAKRISFIVLVLSFVLIIYFLIKEQIRGRALSGTENMILSITYLVVAISLIILFRIKSIEDKNGENREK